MTTLMIMLLVMVVVVVLVLAIVSRSGPRVTQIDRTVRKEKDPDDA